MNDEVDSSKCCQVEVIILAAGAAKRFGSSKQLASLKGMPLLQHVIQKVQALGLKPWLVLGAHRAQILQNRQIDTDSCHLIWAKSWRQGMASSIKAALRQVTIREPEVDGVLVMLADQPVIETSDLKMLLKAIHENQNCIVCCEYHDSIGVPVYFPRQYFEELRKLQGDQGAKSLIKTLPHLKVSLGSPPVDVDCPEDLDRLIRAKESD